MIIAMAAMLSGCLSPAPEAPTSWLISWNGAPAPKDGSAAPEKQVLRISQISVRAPYDGVRLAVLRGDGSIAFDSRNVFAAAPSQLLTGSARDMLESCGKYSAVVTGRSNARSDQTVEISVDLLALDFRKGGKGAATVSLSVVWLKGRDILRVTSGSAAVEIGDDGDYSAAFSSAFARALENAFEVR